MEIALGTRLRELRRERNLSQRDLAERANLSPNAISLIERGEISPSVATLQRLAGALSVKMSYFFDDLDEMHVVYSRTGRRPRIASKDVIIEGLGARVTGQEMEPFIVSLAPEADTCTTSVVHTGHEFVCCLTGRLEYVVAGTAYPLGPGWLSGIEAGIRLLTWSWLFRFLYIKGRPDGISDPLLLSWCTSIRQPCRRGGTCGR
jgi:transcriptional regulator with XRE-family HTH domain